MSKHNMIRWSGIFLILAGVCIALGTIIHPSKETPQIILAEETRLITGHWFLTFYSAFLMLGLTGAYASQSEALGRLGLAGFLLLFFGTLFYAVSSDYGFNAPVLARLAPQTLDAINAYPSVIVMDGLFVLFLFVGFILFGIAIERSHVFPPWSGILIAIGWSLFMICAPLALFVFEPLWILAVLGTVILGVGLGSVGYVLLSHNELTET
jgi:drug/metabolite transporter (DMT)-like permease